MFRKLDIFRLFSLLLITGLVFACLPAAEVQAASGETLYVANWSSITDAGVTGRPAVVKVGETYHMWYGPTDTALYHTTSTDPASFSAGTQTTYDSTPMEVASPAVFEEGGIFYMVAYKASSNLIFSLYSSNDGDSWNYVKDVFDASSFTDINKIDSPFVFKDGGTFRLYFQLKNAAKTNYKIYTAESSQAITAPEFAFTIANSGNPVLIPGVSGQWDSNYVMHPWVIKDNGVYFMYYSAYGTNQVIGLAKSNDGYNWVKSQANPILGSDRLGEPVVLNDNGTWRMWYLGSGSVVKYFTSTGPIEFSSIKSAIDKATSGDTITVAAGTYSESVLVNKYVKIIGSGSGVDGTIVNTPTSVDPSLGVFQISASGPSAAEPILIQNIRVMPNGRAGISIGKFGETTGTSVSNLKLDNVAVIGTNNNAQTEQERGLYVGLLSTLNNLTVNNSAFNNLAYGWYLQKQVSSDTSTVSNVVVTGTTFNHNNLKGFYAEKLTDAVFTDCTWSENGFNATGLPSYFIPWMSGVDLNLKAGTYQNISFNNPTITNNALGGAQHGVGIAIKARNDASSYNTYPATLTNVTISGGIITGNERGVRIGEPYKNNSGPTNVNIENTAIYNNLKKYTGSDGSAYGDVINYSLASVDATHVWFGSSGGPATGKIYGDVTYAPWCTDAACTAFAPVDGRLELPGGVTAAEIQQAINNAPAGTTIVIPAGNYSFAGGFTVADPSLTILLENGTVIENESPCFTVNASYSRITSETIGGAKCVPTNGSNGIDVAAGLTNVIIEGLEIDGTGQTTGSGIHFAGAVTDVQIVNNFIHNLGANGVTFTTAPSGVVEIQGNLIKDNSGSGVSAPSDIDVTYNSWGSVDGPNGTGGDGISGITSFSPWTHVDLSMASTGTPWLNNVLPGYTITYTVSGNFVNAMGADFDLTYPASLLTLTSTTEGTAFSPVSGTSVLNTDTEGTISFTGIAKDYLPVNGTQTLFTATFTAAATGGAGILDFMDSSDAFSMAPASGSSTNIYAASLADGAVNVITVFPSLTPQGLDATFAQGYGQEFALVVNNPTTGVSYTDPQFNFTLPTGTLLEYYNGSGWDTVVGGIVDLPSPLANDGLDHTYTFRVTFAAAGTAGLSVNLVDASFDPDAVLASYTKSDIVVNSNYTVTGTFSMQGRTVRSGIPVTLTMVSPALYGPFNATSLDIISGNVVFSNIPVASYVITTNQPRYLDVTVDLNKTKAVSANTALAALELRGGDADDDNVVEVGDASIIGAQYGNTLNAIVNFDFL